MPRSIAIPQLSYRAMRGLQISIVFTFTIFVQELLRYPRAGWTGFAVMMIYAGFDNGSTIFRAYHRFLGVILGLLTGYFLWFLGHVDYRTLVLVIPATVFFAYFLVGRAYSVPTVFTVNTSLIGTGYFDVHNTFSVTFFLVDYAVCTLIAFAIILAFEYFWFRKYHMMGRFIYDTQTEVIHRHLVLENLLNNKKIHHITWFKACVALTRSLFEVNSLVHNAQFSVSSKRAVGDEFDKFAELTNRIFIGQKALYYAHYTKRYSKYDYNHLQLQVESDLAKLKTIVSHGRVTRRQLWSYI